MESKYGFIIDQVLGLDGCIWTKYFCMFMDRDETSFINPQKRTWPISSHHDWMSLVNKWYIIWLSRKLFLPCRVANHSAGFGSSCACPLMLTELTYLFCILTAIDGNYTEWTAWSDCSVTCGGGSQTRSRICSNPAPQNGGKNCNELGPANQTQACNPNPCRKFFFFSINENEKTLWWLLM